MNNRTLRLVAIWAVLLGAVHANPWAGKHNTLWRDPGPIERLDFTYGPGGRAGQPAPPFTFIKEDKSGTSPKLFVRDARGRTWNVKFGEEVRAEVFGSRVAWAAGYFAEPTYFVRSGMIRGVRDLSMRAAAVVGRSGSFRDARFQLRDPKLEFLDKNDWSWTYNPFIGTRELAGLKIVMMLTSNFDSKDARDQDEGSNTAIFRRRGSRNEYIYAFTDWGRTLGKWGSVLRHSTWNCSDFSADTGEFVRVHDSKLQWGFGGRHTADVAGDIGVNDISWFIRRFGRVRDAQLKAGLIASGASLPEAQCFTRELRRRIDMLRSVAGGHKKGRALVRRPAEEHPRVARR